MSPDRVLITGANGFVGRAVVARLREAGHPLTLAVRRPSTAGRYPEASSSPDDRVVVVGEVDRTTDWSDAMVGAGAVVHLAAHVHVAPERAGREAGRFDEVNHLGSVRLYEAASSAGARVFVYMSSITVLGSTSPPGGGFDDASVPKPETPYARSKLAAETALVRLAEAGGPTLTILRPPLVSGPGVAGNLRSLARLAALPCPLPFGAIGNRRTLVSADNLADAVAAILACPSAGTFAIGDAEPLSLGDIVQALRDGAGRRAPILPIPRVLAAALRRAGSHGRRLFGDLTVDSRRFRETFGWHDRVDTRAVLRATGAYVAAGRSA